MPDHTQQKWYIRRGLEKLGPFDWDKLGELVQTGEVLPHDLLAHKQLKKWTRADELPELIELFRLVEADTAAQAWAAERNARAMNSPVAGACQRMTFTVDAMDPESKAVSAVDIVAATVAEARQQVAAAGMTVQSVRLKSVTSVPPPVEVDRSPLPLKSDPVPSLASTPSSHSPERNRGMTCPYCETTMVPGGGGFANGSEVRTCVFLMFVVLFIGGVFYYYWATSKPYCPTCKRRVSR